MASVLLVTGCSGDVYDKQVAVYDDYSSRLDTVSSYESLKKLNTNFNAAIVAVVKGNSEEVVQAHKEASSHKEGIKSLVKAESAYVKAYLNKVMDYVLPKQIDLYTEYLAKIADAKEYDELVRLNRSLTSAISKLGSENNDEFKKATAFKICQDKVAALNKAGEAYQKAYIEKVTPLLYGAEAGIYNKYRAKLSGVDGYRDLKELKLFLDKEIALFTNDNSMIKIAPDAYVAEKEIALKAKEEFATAYMNRIVMPLIEYQKNLYTGALKLFKTTVNSAEFNSLKSDFLTLNKQFIADNSSELDFIATAIAKGNTVYRKEMEEVNAIFRSIEVVLSAGVKK